MYSKGNIDSNAAGFDSDNDDAPCGLIFYQAGVVVLSSSVMQKNQGDGHGGLLQNNTPTDFLDVSTNVGDVLKDHEISGSTWALRKRIMNIQFNNTVELNSTVYFCRVNHNEYNYSSNPTYLNKSKIRVKTKTTDLPVSYITTVGLYNDNNELMAVAKLSEALKKTPDNEFTIRVRLDY